MKKQKKFVRKASDIEDNNESSSVNIAMVGTKKTNVPSVKTNASNVAAAAVATVATVVGAATSVASAASAAASGRDDSTTNTSIENSISGENAVDSISTQRRNIISKKNKGKYKNVVTKDKTERQSLLNMGKANSISNSPEKS